MQNRTCHPTVTRVLLLLLTVAPLALLTRAASAHQDEDFATLKAEIEKLRDDVEEDRIEAMGELKTAEAAAFLIEQFGRMSSLYMQREILRALRSMDGVADAQGPALQLMMDTATAAGASELREAALRCLGQCREGGKPYLVRIVASGADSAVREQAMELHTARAEDADHAWYLELYEDLGEQGDEDARGRGKDDEEGAEIVYSLPRVRELAFRAISGTFEEVDLLARYPKEPTGAIRVAMLEELASRRSDDALDLAQDVLGDVTMPGYLRCAAADVVAQFEGPEAAKGFIKLGQKQITPTDLRRRLAELLAEMKDEGVDKSTNKLIGKGKPHEKLFALWATVHQLDEKTTKKIRKGIRDKDPEVRDLTIAVLGERQDADALKDLRKILDKPKDPTVLPVLLQAMSRILADEDSWITELEGYTQHEDLDVRNAAITEIGRLDLSQHKDLLYGLLDHPAWSTRLAALRAIEAMRRADSVGPIIARMEREDGRMRIEFADTLWRLTGEAYGPRQKAWLAWFEGEGGKVELIEPGKLRRLAREQEDRRLKQISRAEFFGIRIQSKRVIFIVDISGSMMQPLRSEYVGRVGEPRIDRAKKELKRVIDELEDGASFNIITFSNGTDPWLDGGVAESSGKTRDEAKAWVDLLGAFGATNLYEAVQQAFADPEADTIIILSDGEPTVGPVIDPGGIREHVRGWNEHRGVEIHCIALGGSLQILEWLADDHGGRYTRHD